MSEEVLGTRTYVKVVKPFFSFKDSEIIRQIVGWAILGYSSFVAMMLLPISHPLFWICCIPHLLALTAGLLFFHSAVHFRKCSPWVERTFNYLFGYLYSYPSYVNYTHVSRHHNNRYYATESDTRYLPLVFYRNNFIAISVMLITYPLLNLFAIILRTLSATLFILLPFKGMRRVFRFLRAFDMFTGKVKLGDPRDEEEEGLYHRQDVATAVIHWVMIALVCFGVVEWKLIWIYLASLWYFHSHQLVLTAIEHGFDEYTEETTRPVSTENTRLLEIQDSMTFEQRGFWRWFRFALMSDATCYHCLHHWYPQIPDVHLHRAHLALLKELPENHPYRATIQRGFFAAFFRMLGSKTEAK